MTNRPGQLSLRRRALAGVLPALVLAAPGAAENARAEAERYFTARGSRKTAARAKALLMRLGNHPR